MKWFHHECAARHDPKLQILGASYGAEGIGIYWGLLEEIGQHSDTFHLKVIGISDELDQKFSEFMRDEEKAPENLFHIDQGLTRIPRLPMKLLAKNLFTSARKLQAVIALCVEVGLFDSSKWLSYNVLYSPAFELRADDYTRRSRRTLNNVRIDSERSPNTVRTVSEHGANTLRTKAKACSDNVHLETEAEVEEEQKKKRNRKEQEMLLKNTQNVDNSKSDTPVGVSTQNTSGTSAPDKSGSGYVIEPTDEVFDQYSLTFHSIIQKWNRDNPSQAIDWSPSASELKKLFCGGEYERKLSMCFHAYKLLGEKIHYPELVIRSLRLLLNTNAKSRISNPFGWLWTCLHGNGNGTKPWVQLLTAEEENGNGHNVARGP